MEAAKILERCDVDGDGTIDEVEFEAYFEHISKSITAYKKEQAQKRKVEREEKRLEPVSPRSPRAASVTSKGSMSPRRPPTNPITAEDELAVAMMSSEALKKFHTLDYDRSGTLEGEEVILNLES